jgi:hypothetical protein
MLLPLGDRGGGVGGAEGEGEEDAEDEEELERDPEVVQIRAMGAVAAAAGDAEGSRLYDELVQEALAAARERRARARWASLSHSCLAGHRSSRGDLTLDLTASQQPVFRVQTMPSQQF